MHKQKAVIECMPPAPGYLMKMEIIKLGLSQAKCLKLPTDKYFREEKKGYRTQHCELRQPDYIKTQRQDQAGINEHSVSVTM